MTKIIYIYTKNVFLAIMALIGFILFLKGFNCFLDEIVLKDKKNDIRIQFICILLGLLLIICTNSIFNQAGITMNQNEFRDILNCIHDPKGLHNQNKDFRENIN